MAFFKKQKLETSGTATTTTTFGRENGENGNGGFMTSYNNNTPPILQKMQGKNDNVEAKKLLTSTFQPKRSIRDVEISENNNYGDSNSNNNNINNSSTKMVQIYCNSKDRDKTIDPSTDKFTIPVFPGTLGIKNFNRVEIGQVEFPVVHSNISERYNRLYFSEDTDYALLATSVKEEFTDLFIDDDPEGTAKTGVPTMFVLEIPAENYSANTLVNTLNNIIQTATPVTNVQIPSYAQDYAASAASLRQRLSPQNNYTFHFDTVSLRITMKSDNAVGFQVHCPSLVFPVNSADSTIVNNPDSVGIQVKINSATYNKDQHKLTIVTTRAVHNVINNSVVSLKLRSDKTSATLTIPNFMLYSTDSEIIDQSTFKITLSEDSTWTDVFGTWDAGNTVYTGDNTVYGVLETLASSYSAWGVLGFTLSNSEGYTKYPITGIYSAECSDSANQHIFTTSQPMNFDSTVTSLHFVNLEGINENSSFAISSDITPTTFSVAVDKEVENVAYLSLNSSIPPDDAYFYVPGYISGNRIPDLRGPTMVFIYVEVNGMRLGNIYSSFDTSCGRSNNYLGSVRLDATQTTTVFASNKQTFIGAYNAINHYHEAPTKITVQMFNDKGQQYNLNGLDWSITLNFCAN